MHLKVGAMSKKIVTKSKEIVKNLNAWKQEIATSGKHIPYLTVRDVNKIGRRHWIHCPRQGRDVHLLSDGEIRAYKILLWQPNVISVEEQYALDIDETLDIATGANIIHPRDWKTFLGHVMTTDFVVTIRIDSGSTKCIAYTFKYWNQLFEHQEDGSVKQIKARTWQKFAIEREYWRVRGVEYRVITELDTTKPCAWNIEYFELAHDLVASSDELKEFGQAFIETWTENPRHELQDHFKAVQKLIGPSYQRIQSLFQYSGLHHLIPLNTDRYIRVFRPVELLL